MLDNGGQAGTGTGPCLYICSTPIGNLQDVSLRLLETLRTADVVAAEDTRHTRKLLTRYDIHPPCLISYHEHNHAARAADLVRFWQQGKSVAVVSDAGTPGISDPGDDAVSLALEHDIPVIPVPGASAVLTALVASGLPSQPFTFLGFLPRQPKARNEALAPYIALPSTLVCYEAPHRLYRTLEGLAEAMPNREAVVAKELTKRHETFLHGTLPELAAYFRDNEPRGEYVIVLGPPRTATVMDGDEQQAAAASVMESAVRMVDTLMENGQPHAKAVREAARQTGVRRHDLYQATIDRKV